MTPYFIFSVPNFQGGFNNMDIMNIPVTMNFWFLVALCLACILIGVLLRRRSSLDRNRYY